jgi:hypothetical protein
MRSILASCSDDYQPLARALVYYSDDSMNQAPNSTAWPALGNFLKSCANV